MLVNRRGIKDWKASALEPGREDGDEQSVSSANLVTHQSKDQAAKCEAQHEAGVSHGHPDLSYFKVMSLIQQEI